MLTFRLCVDTGTLELTDFPCLRSLTLNALDTHLLYNLQDVVDIAWFISLCPALDSLHVICEALYSLQSWASLLHDKIHIAPLQDLDNILLSHPNHSSLSVTFLIEGAPQWVILRLTVAFQSALPNAYKHGIVKMAFDTGS